MRQGRHKLIKCYGYCSNTVLKPSWYIHHFSAIEGNCATVIIANPNKAAANPSRGTLCQNSGALKPIYTTSKSAHTHFGKPANHQQILTFFPLPTNSLYSPLPASQHSQTQCWLYTNICSFSQVRFIVSLFISPYPCNVWPPYIMCKHYSCENRAMYAKSAKL